MPLRHRPVGRAIGGDKHQPCQTRLSLRNLMSETEVFGVIHFRRTAQNAVEVVGPAWYLQRNTLVVSRRSRDRAGTVAAKRCETP